MANFYTVAFLPAVQRDLYLARCLRRVEDVPLHIETLRVEWEDMKVSFATDDVVSEASVEVREDISISVFSRRMESLLDCGAHSEGQEWVLKWADRISRYGDPALVRRLLCDKIASIDGRTGETIGVLKIKRRSVKAGHAKIRLVPAEDSLQVVCRHSSAQGLKAVWKSVLWRLRPQYPARKKGSEENQPAGVGQAVVKVVAPCILVYEKQGGYHYNRKAAWLSEQGVEVDLTKDLNYTLPLEKFAGKDLPRDTGRFYCRVELSRLPAGKPEGITIDENVIVISERYWEDFAKKAKALSDWLGLGWNLPSAREE